MMNVILYLRFSKNQYIDVTLERYGMRQCKAVKSPLAFGPVLPTGSKLLSDEAAWYRSLIGSLLCISTFTRPDGSFAVSFLSRFIAEPKHQHLIAAKRILRNLKGIFKHGLVFNGSSNVPNILQGYSDSDWGNDYNNRSTSGYVFTMSGGRGQ
mgnify:FL=1